MRAPKSLDAARKRRRDENVLHTGLDGHRPVFRFRSGRDCWFRERSVRRDPVRGDHRSEQPRTHREGAHRRQRRHRALPHRRSATGHVYRQLYAQRLALLRAKWNRTLRFAYRRRRCRADDGVLDGYGQRVACLHRGRRLQRQARVHLDERRDQVTPDGPELQRGARPCTRRRHELERRGDRHRDLPVPHTRRPRERGTPDAGRPEHREPAGWQYSHELRRRRRRRAGGHVCLDRWPR